MPFNKVCCWKQLSFTSSCYFGTDIKNSINCFPVLYDPRELPFSRRYMHYHVTQGFCYSRRVTFNAL